MKIAITGTSSGVGLELKRILSQDHVVIGVERKEVDLDDIDQVLRYDVPYCDIFINCAGHDLGGKVPFLDHTDSHVVSILNANLISPVLLSQKALQKNINCKIVNITSTNIHRYWGNDLIYTLSKESLSRFGHLIKIDHPKVRYLEVILGLTKTNFNINRHKANHKEIDNLYENAHLTTEDAATKIVDVLFDDHIKRIEVTP
jgi:short-subunit dehydrogenase